MARLTPDDVGDGHRLRLLHLQLGAEAHLPAWAEGCVGQLLPLDVGAHAVERLHAQPQILPAHTGESGRSVDS